MGGAYCCPSPLVGGMDKVLCKILQDARHTQAVGPWTEKSQVAEKQAEIRHFFANSVLSSMLANHCSIRILNCKSSEEDKQNALDDQKRYF